jgi:hypothetical protein
MAVHGQYKCIWFFFWGDFDIHPTIPPPKWEFWSRLIVPCAADPWDGGHSIPNDRFFFSKNPFCRTHLAFKPPRNWQTQSYCGWAGLLLLHTRSANPPADKVEECKAHLVVDLEEAPPDALAACASMQLWTGDTRGAKTTIKALKRWVAGVCFFLIFYFCELYIYTYIRVLLYVVCCCCCDGRVIYTLVFVTRCPKIHTIHFCFN